MPSYYEMVGEEPTYKLAENIIKATIYTLKGEHEDINNYSYVSSVRVKSFGLLDYSPITVVDIKNRKETMGAIHLIIKHFPDVLIKVDNSIYIKVINKHLLNTTDLLVMDYYLLLLNEYEERIKKYQRYLKKQQDKQRNKLLFVLFLPFILFILTLIAGD